MNFDERQAGKPCPMGDSVSRRTEGLVACEERNFAKVLSPFFYVPFGSLRRGFYICASQQKSPKRFWSGECLFLKKALPRKKITRVSPHPPRLPVKNNFAFCASSKNALKFFGEGCGEPPWFTKGVPRKKRPASPRKIKTSARYFFRRRVRRRTSFGARGAS